MNIFEVLSLMKMLFAFLSRLGNQQIVRNANSNINADTYRGTQTYACHVIKSVIKSRPSCMASFATGTCYGEREYERSVVKVVI